MTEHAATYPAVFNLTPILPLLPFAAFVLIILFTNRNKKLSAGLAIGGIALSWILGWAIAFTTFGIEHFGEAPWRVMRNWLPTGSTWQAFGFALDPLTGAMLFMVPFVCFLIFVYAYGYMAVGKEESSHDERGKPAEPGHADRLASRFFAYIALFATGMIGFVLSDNFILALVFWEIMGLCSYLLIGFWFARKYPNPKQITPKEAGLKAFLTTRVGDTFMLAGIIFVYIQTGSLSFAEIFQPATLEALATSMVNLPIFGEIAWSTLIAVLIFFGAIGKSAQFPLHVWLPDAMEGPTPVSALIHAATMVSAGVYLIIRTFPLMQAGEHHGALPFIAFIGAFTALFAATIALAQNDIKKVLAYSTISQLGFMFAALGIGAYVAATLHLLTHAFFKALLFLGSGSVIHGMEHGHHAAEHAHHYDVPELKRDHSGEPGMAHAEMHHAPAPHAFDPQDMRNMGGLFRAMPRTAITFIVGGLSLAGFPFVTAGFWSKDEILADAWAHNQLIFAVLSIAALVTAFYTARQIVMAFFGKPRSDASRTLVEHAAHGKNVEQQDSIFAWMTVPLMVLGVFSVVLGWVAIPRSFPVVGVISTNPFHHYIGGLAEALEIPAEELAFSWVPVSASLVAALGGLFLGWLVYRGYAARAKADTPDPMARPLGPFYAILQNKYYFDELYYKVFVRGTQRLSGWLFKFDNRWVIDPIVNGVGALGRRLSEIGHWFDVHIVDGAVNGIGAVTGYLGAGIRLIQTGKAQMYLAVAVAGVAVLLALFFVIPK